MIHISIYCHCSPKKHRVGFLTPSITSQQEPQYRNCPLPQTSSSSWWPIKKMDIIKPVVQPPTPPWWLFPVVFSLAPSPLQCCRPCPHRRPVGKSFKRKALLLLQSVKRKKNLASLVKPTTFRLGTRLDRRRTGRFSNGSKVSSLGNPTGGRVTFLLTFGPC